jgi:hypothetical protein
MRKIVVRLGVVAALAAIALVRLGAQETADVFQGEAAENFLTKAKIVSYRPFGSGITRPLRVQLELDGIKHEAIFKSIDVRKDGAFTLQDGTVEIDFQDSWQTEIAAYVVDRIIGLRMVPATVKRKIEARDGSMQWFVESMMPEADRLAKKLVAPDAESWSQQTFDTRLFDQLIANVDRHLNNILVTKEFNLRLVDHSRAFRPNRALKDPDSLQRFNRTLLEGMKKLEKKDLQKRLGDYLSAGQIDRLLQRRDAILKLAEQRVKEKGEANVLYK